MNKLFLIAGITFSCLVFSACGNKKTTTVDKRKAKMEKRKKKHTELGCPKIDC